MFSVSRGCKSLGFVSGFLLLFHVSEANADVDVGRLVSMYGNRNIGLNAGAAPLSAMSRHDDGKMRLFVYGPVLDPATEIEGLSELRPGVYAYTATPKEVKAFLSKHPLYRVTWAPPRKPLLDRAIRTIRADVVHQDYGLSGKGVVVGIVDTGVDVRHPDLRNADGTTRIAWLLDLSKTSTKKHPSLENKFNCDDISAGCAVFSDKDVDELINNDIAGDEPRDTYGHGTHVASLAVGNGLGSSEKKYIGIAPEATLVVVRATRDDQGFIDDADIVLATKFVFEVAQQLNLPAVVNLSLGGDFGAHDGTSPVERELSALVGEDHPGRSIVVAGGNSGSLNDPMDTGYPGPFGIHATVQVPPYGSARVPILIGASGIPNLDSQIYLWVATRPGDNLSVGLETRDSDWIEPQGLGDSAEVKHDGMTGIIDNGITESDRPRTVDHLGAFVAIEGKFESDTVLSLILEGHGTASIWVEPFGGIEPSNNSFGVNLPAAQREGTITVPATAPNLIAVGATLDRSTWTDVDGEAQKVVPGLVRYGVEGEILPFSAAGPNAIDGIKPDLVAPGGYVVGAMSRLADPRTFTGKYGMFDFGDACSTSSNSCLVVDDNHALSFGTSMASPIVTGAVALLLQKSPELSQREILRLLQSGAKNVYGLYSTYSQMGAGALDIEGALLALENRALGSVVSGPHSYLTLGVAFLRPDPTWPVAGMIHLRDELDRAVDVAVSQMRLSVDHGTLVRSLTRRGPGYYEFSVAADADSGGQTFRIALEVDGKRVTYETRSIAVDAPNVRRLAVASRGCSIAQTPASSGRFSFGVKAAGLLLSFLWLRGRVTQRERRCSISSRDQS
jgi:subtilisin family serine protease